MGSIISCSPKREGFQGFKNNNLLTSLWLPKQHCQSPAATFPVVFPEEEPPTQSIRTRITSQSMIYLYLSAEADSQRSKSSISSRFLWPTSSKGCPGAGNLHHSNRDLKEQECTGVKGMGCTGILRRGKYRDTIHSNSPSLPPLWCEFFEFSSLFPVWLSLSIRRELSALLLDTTVHFVEQYICRR